MHSLKKTSFVVLFRLLNNPNLDDLFTPLSKLEDRFHLQWRLVNSLRLRRVLIDKIPASKRHSPRAGIL